MFKKVSLTLASLVVLSACSSACSTMPGDAQPTAGEEVASTQGVDTPSMTSESHMGKMAGHSSAVAGGMGNKVYFAFDSAALSVDSQKTLKAVAEKIKAANPERIVVEGHCDERGTREYNLALGDRRAVSAKKYLVGLGVDASKITTISYGKERPMNAAHTAEAWAQNRRSVVIFE